MDNALYQKIENILKHFQNGGMVIVLDDENRENEGDLIVAAQHCTHEQMAILIRHTSGIVCAPLTRDIAKRLELTPMVSHNDSPHGTAFTVSVDARFGTTTGISAADRIAAVHLLSDPASNSTHFVRPGHMFPLIASDLGVLGRAGHTEAAIDLCKLCGLEPVAVISELMNDDGTVMSGQSLHDFAAQHHYPCLSIAELIAYRRHIHTHNTLSSSQFSGAPHE